MDSDLSAIKTLKENFTAQSEKSLRWRGSCSRFHRASSMPLDRQQSTATPHRPKDHRLSRGATKHAPPKMMSTAGTVEANDHKMSADFQKLNRLLMTGRTLSDSLERLVEETNHSVPSSDSQDDLAHHRHRRHQHHNHHPSKQSAKTREDGKWFGRGKTSDRAGSRLINLREISSSAPLIEIVESGSKGYLDATNQGPGHCDGGRQGGKKDARTHARIDVPLTPDIRVHIASDSDMDQDEDVDPSRHELEPETTRLPVALDGLIDSLHCIADQRARLADESQPLMDDADQQTVTNNQPLNAQTVSPTNYLRDQIAALFQVSDNKLALKLFGNKNALLREKLRQKAVGNCVIHPCSSFRSVGFHSY